MGLEIELCEKLTSALVALKPFNALVDLHVLVEVRSLGECEVAARLLALKRSFPSVNS